jgi:glycosyltransferase involved in cell wall biosynthesis
MFFSVITINLNNKKGLERTVQSVISQSFHNFEYIVIDGDSNDGSQEVIQSYQDRIDYWISEPDTGIYQAMNKGIKVAKGDFLLFLNSGDTMASGDTLESVLEYLDIEDEIVAGFVKQKTNFSEHTHSGPNEITLEYLLQYSLPHQAVFFNKNLFEKYGYYDENLKIAADWAYYFNLFVIEDMKYKYIPVFVAYYEGNGISSNKKYFDIHRAERDSVLRSLFPKRIYRSFLALQEVKTITSTQRYKLVVNIQRSKFLRRATLVLLMIISQLVDLFLGKQSKEDFDRCKS